jgi:hypothetical protein
VKILGSKKGEIRVKTVVLAAALVVAAVVPASAFQQATWDGGVNLECAVVKTTEGYKKDDDPIYKIMVELLHDDHTPMSLRVMHVAASGAVYDRDGQYRQTNLTNTPGRLEYSWTGTMAKNRAYTMRGSLWRNTGNNWFYSEMQFKGGVMAYGMLSRCRVVEAD